MSLWARLSFSCSRRRLVCWRRRFSLWKTIYLLDQGTVTHTTRHDLTLVHRSSLTRYLSTGSSSLPSPSIIWSRLSFSLAFFDGTWEKKSLGVNNSRVLAEMKTVISFRQIHHLKKSQSNLRPRWGWRWDKKKELEHGHIWCLAHILAHTLGKKKPSLPNLRIYYKILWNKLDFYLSGPRPIRIKPNVGHDPWPLSGPQLTSRIWKFPIKTPTMLNCVAQSLDTTYGQHLSHKCLPNEVKCTVSNQFFIQMNFWPTGKIK